MEGVKDPDFSLTQFMDTALQPACSFFDKHKPPTSHLFPLIFMNKITIRY